MSEFKEYKLGDKVVLIKGEDNRVFVVDFAGWDTNLSVTGLSKYKDIRGYVWGKELFRKAKPEEIAAGHRIDDIKMKVSFGFSLMSPERIACVDLIPKPVFELETLDKPENHISPLCKSKDV